MLSLPEQLLLLALDDETGEISPVITPVLGRSLIAAVLLDLYFHGRLERSKPVRADATAVYRLILPISKTGYAYCDHVCETLAEHNPPDNVGSFGTLGLRYLDRAEPFHYLQTSEYRSQYPLVAEDLLRRGALVMERGGILRHERFLPSEQDTGEDSLRSALYVATNHQAALPTDESLLALLLLITTAGLAKNVWGAKQDIADWRVKKALRLVTEPNTVWADADRFARYGAIAAN